MLVNCVVYQDGKRLQEIDVEAISDHVAVPDRFVWVALHEPSPDDLAKMQEEFGLHPLAVEDARHGHQRPKLEEYDDEIFAVLHPVEAVGEHLNAGELAIFAGRNYVLTVRRHSERGFADVRARCEREPELLRHGSGFVLYALMDAVVDRYFPVLEGLAEDLERLEDRIFATGLNRADIEALYAQRRKLTRMKHAAVPLLEAVSRLAGGRVPAVCNGMQHYFRDVYDHLVRINQSIEAQRESLGTVIAVQAALANMQQGDTTRKLAAYGALIAVPTLIVGVYGMNFDSMPELRMRLGYPFTIGAMVLLDWLLFRRFRRDGWL